MSYVIDGSQTNVLETGPIVIIRINVLETCPIAIIRVNVLETCPIAIIRVNVLETCPIAIIRINAIRNTKSLIYVCVCVYSSLPSSQGLMGQEGSRKVRPEGDQVCSTYKVLHDLSSNQDTQGLHSLCMLNCKLTCTVFSHNGLLPAIHLDTPETCPPCPSIV